MVFATEPAVDIKFPLVQLSIHSPEWRLDAARKESSESPSMMTMPQIDPSGDDLLPLDTLGHYEPFSEPLSAMASGFRNLYLSQMQGTYSCRQPSE